MHFQLAAVSFVVLALTTAIDASDTEPTIGLFGQFVPQELSAEAWIWFLVLVIPGAVLFWLLLKAIPRRDKDEDQKQDNRKTK